MVDASDVALYWRSLTQFYLSLVLVDSISSKSPRANAIDAHFKSREIVVTIFCLSFMVVYQLHSSDTTFQADGIWLQFGLEQGSTVWPKHRSLRNSKSKLSRVWHVDPTVTRCRLSSRDDSIQLTLPQKPWCSQASEKYVVVVDFKSCCYLRKVSWTCLQVS